MHRNHPASLCHTDLGAWSHPIRKILSTSGARADSQSSRSGRTHVDFSRKGARLGTTLLGRREDAATVMCGGWHGAFKVWLNGGDPLDQRAHCTGFDLADDQLNRGSQACEPVRAATAVTVVRQ
jgi:hypothetical protein